MKNTPPISPELRRKPLPYRLVRNAFRAFGRFYFRWQAVGVDNVPVTGPAILAANHVSYLDPPLVGAALGRPVYFLARSSLFRFPVFGWFIRKMQAVPVDREGGTGGAGLKAVVDRLATGGAIILFPEGTRSRDGGLQPVRAGVGLMVLKSGAPVIPIRLFGLFEAYGRHRLIPRPGRITLVYGPPLDFAAARAEARHCDRVRLKALYQEVADEIMRAIGQLGPDGPISPPDRPTPTTPSSSTSPPA